MSSGRCDLHHRLVLEALLEDAHLQARANLDGVLHVDERADRDACAPGSALVNRGCVVAWRARRAHHTGGGWERTAANVERGLAHWRSR